MHNYAFTFCSLTCEIRFNLNFALSNEFSKGLAVIAISKAVVIALGMSQEKAVAA